MKFHGEGELRRKWNVEGSKRWKSSSILNKQTNKKQKNNQPTNQTSEWVSERASERANERTNERTNKWMGLSKTTCKSEWIFRYEWEIFHRFMIKVTAAGLEYMYCIYVNIKLDLQLQWHIVCSKSIRERGQKPNRIEGIQ